MKAWPRGMLCRWLMQPQLDPVPSSLSWTAQTPCRVKRDSPELPAAQPKGQGLGLQPTLLFCLLFLVIFFYQKASPNVFLPTPLLCSQRERDYSGLNEKGSFRGTAPKGLHTRDTCYKARSLALKRRGRKRGAREASHVSGFKNRFSAALEERSRPLAKTGY